MTCPVPNCGNTVHQGHLMCFGHWRAVHFTLQMKVQRAWKNFVQAKKANMKLACLRAYRAARDEAIASVSPQGDCR